MEAQQLSHPKVNDCIDILLFCSVYVINLCYLYVYSKNVILYTYYQSFASANMDQLNIVFTLLWYSFDAREFLMRQRGKKIMFVGDSLSYNMWQSLTCKLYTAAPNSNYTYNTDSQLYTVSFLVGFCKIFLRVFYFQYAPIW